MIKLIKMNQHLPFNKRSNYNKKVFITTAILKYRYLMKIQLMTHTKTSQKCDKLNLHSSDKVFLIHNHNNHFIIL